MLALLWLAVVAVVGSVVLIVDAAGPGVSRLPDQAYLVPLLLALVAFIATLIEIGDRRFRGLLWRVWNALKAAPVAVAVGALALPVLVLILRLVTSPVVELSTNRVRGIEALYLGAFAAVAGSGALRLRRRSGPPPPNRVQTALYSTAVLAMIVYICLNLIRPPLYDDPVLHGDVNSQFAHEPWKPHLIAAAYQHGAYGYYFDTYDENLMTGACRSLGPGFTGWPARPTSLYWYARGTDTFIRTCDPVEPPRPPTPTPVHADGHVRLPAAVPSM